ncbi:MAG TPA: ABC transporter substrate-binding protein [Candidatus Avacidaminococcus intestinavium]|uniref:ABC transporter substrate-binding protein n=1 Tax=Candidatus Avacidaminococcus intestinavium TaxID=2840684 RepID=A0A9D1MQQ9_9FIRM|nr:ABC transporter substrate-binding protein [Candidatus Avacidaminococcus intestinavium]
MSKFKIFLFPLLLILCIIYFYEPTHDKVNAAEEKTISVYSVFPDDLTLALLNSYKVTSKSDVNFQLFDKRIPLEATKQKPDIYLASREMLIALSQDQQLQALSISQSSTGLSLLADEHNSWQSFCYDPYIFLVNYNYARKTGQKNLRTWSDLVLQENISISMEDLSSTPEMRYFLAAMTSSMGEEKAIEYFKILHKKIPHYAKFAISPIRLTTIGETDVAITSRNKVFKYIENDFPAFLVTPLDGVPAKVFAIGLDKESNFNETGSAFAKWLITDKTAAEIAERLGYGYLFISTEESSAIINKPDRLWLDTKYMTEDRQSELVDTWLQNVRFASKKN